MSLKGDFMIKNARGPVLGRRRRVWVATSFLSLLVAALAPSPVAADIPSSAFPTKAEIKSELNGRGSWFSVTSTFTRTLGSRPRGCRSDKQMLDFQEDRLRFYSGRQTGLPNSVYASVAIGVFVYANVTDARDAVTRNASYPERCPKVTEWVCNDCDGISTTWRTRVAARRVGQQSVAWRYRSEDNFKHNGYAIVARRGALVVRVEVGRSRDPFSGWMYPPLIKKAKALRIARMALQTATP
jgi:hypothetical protein